MPVVCFLRKSNHPGHTCSKSHSSSVTSHLPICNTPLARFGLPPHSVIDRSHHTPGSSAERRVVRTTTMHHPLLIVANLPVSISGNLMLFSMITYQFKLLRNPHHRRRCNQVLLVIRFKISNILSRTILRLAIETERVLFSSLCTRIPRTPSYVPQLPSSTKSRTCRIAFRSHAFASLHDFIFVIPPLHALQHFKPSSFPATPLPPPHPFYHHRLNVESYPPALSRLMCFLLK